MDVSHGQLYHAADEDNFEKFQELIQNGADVNEIYEDDTNISTRAILHVCCVKGRCEMVKLLINSGADISIKDSYGQTPLMFSVMTQFIEVAEILLEKDPSIINEDDCTGKSSLHLAVGSGNVDSVRMLLHYDAYVDIQNHEGHTPIMMCCHGNPDPELHMNDILQILIDSGADVNIRDRISKGTALQKAAAGLNLQAVEILLSAGADPNLFDKGRRTPMTNVIFGKVRPNFEINPDVMAVIIMLITCGADLNMKQSEFTNPLIAAITRQAESLVSLFLSYGADVNVTFPSGRTAILLATTKNDLPCIKQLIFFNSRLDMKGYIYKRKEQDEYYIDCMELAIADGKFDLVKLFAAAGYDFNNLKYLFQQGTVPESLLNNTEMYTWLQSWAQNPPSLLDVCVKTTRKALNLQPKEKVDKLPIPNRLKDILLLKHVLDMF